MKKFLRVTVVTLLVGAGSAAILQTLPANVSSSAYPETLTAYLLPSDAPSTIPLKPAAPATPVQSTVAGRVWEVYFSEGQRVRKGQLLLKVTEKIRSAEQRRLDVLLSQHQHAYDTLAAQQPAASTKALATAWEQLAATQKQLAQAPAQLSFLFVTAPQDGIIASRTVAPGDYLTTSTTIATLALLSVDDTTLLLSQAN